MMRGIQITAIGLFSAVFAGVAVAQQQPTPLPDVNVTAPRDKVETRPTAEGAAGNPYAGDIRVEEAKWPVIACTSSRVGVGAAADPSASCRQGPTVMNFEHGAPDNTGARFLSNCQIAHDLVISQVAGLRFEADSLVFDPYYISGIGHQRQDCYVEAIPRNIQAQLVDMNHVTRQATGWGTLQQSGEVTYIAFTVGSDQCMAFEKRGPRWGGGYIWLVHAALCRGDGQLVDLANVETVMNVLHIEVRDPNGNLVR
jgi:hypothetical protein